MAKTRILFLTIFFIVFFINTSISAKSVAVVDEEDEDDFRDPIVQERRLSFIVEEKASDEKRIRPLNWAMFFYVFIAPILLIGCIVGLIVLGVYSFRKWNQAKLDKLRRRRERDKSLSRKLAEKKKEEEVHRMEERFMDSALFGSGATFLSLDGVEELPDSFVSEHSTTERVEIEKVRKALPVDKRIDDMEEVPSLDGLKRPNRGAMRE
ncbi:hypothetical protein ACQ4LE_010364 [Meloidogyne hapla]|uniref:Transmembrane protein n=1 Tax=Meloidogyne hapla TaxID=6305 RepID=A0A1I8BP44_MELHA